jgi:hypothetical protein
MKLKSRNAKNSFETPQLFFLFLSIKLSQE